MQLIECTSSSAEREQEVEDQAVEEMPPSDMALSEDEAVERRCEMGTDRIGKSIDTPRL